MSQCDIDSDSGPFGYIVFCTLETKRTHFPFKHFPFYPPHSGVCCLIPSPCLYPLDQPSSELCFIIPLPPLLVPHSPPFYAPLVRVLPSWSRIYASFFTHLTRYMIHVFRLLFPYPPPPPILP